MEQVLRFFPSSLRTHLSRLAPITLRPPKRAKVLVLDCYSTRHVLPILQEIDYVVFDTDVRKINLWVFVLSLSMGRPSMKTYCAAYVRLSQARVIITTIDNSPVAFQLKQYVPKVLVLILQNGRRSTFGKSVNTSFTDQLIEASHSDRLWADYYFTFGTTEYVQFSELIDAKFVPIGHFKNNYIEDNGERYSEPTLSYISSFPNFDSDRLATVDSDETYLYFDDQPISFREYFESEGFVATWLAAYCQQNSIKFQVVGKRSPNTYQEEQFFRERIPGDWAFIPVCSESDSYRALLRSHLVATVDSTLGYEMFGRGKRTMFFSVRHEFIRGKPLRCTSFGYPEEKSVLGPMWTNLWNPDHFLQVANFVSQCTAAEWESVVSAYSPVVMQFDRQNLSVATVLYDHLDLQVPDTHSIRNVALNVYG